MSAADAVGDDDSLDSLRAEPGGARRQSEPSGRPRSPATPPDEAATLTSASRVAEAAVVEARSAALDARESWLSARERRLASSAAILAAELHAGLACPVCGSVEHPAPAEQQFDHVGADEEQEALTRLTSLDQVAAAAVERATDISRRIALAQGRANGLDVAAADLALAEAQRASPRCERRRYWADAGIEERASRLRGRETLQATVSDRTARSAEAAARLDEAAASLHRKERRLHKALGVDQTVDAAAADLALRVEACTALADAEAATADAREAVAEHGERLRAVLAASPFASGSRGSRGVVATSRDRERRGPQQVGASRSCGG